MKNKTKFNHKLQLGLVIVGVIVSLWFGLKLNLDNTKKVEPNKKAAVVQKATPSTQSLIGKPVPHGFVCMVNDSYMAEQQIAVPVNGKVYYGCCQGCVTTLNKKQASRQAVDPFNGEQVDKAQAYIVLLNSSGAVGYFASEAHFRAYTKSNNM